MINASQYQGTFDDSMRKYSINVLELLDIWMATLVIQQEDIVIRRETYFSAIAYSVKSVTPVS